MTHENSGELYKTWAEIDLGALRHNWRTLSAHVHRTAPDCRIMAVVKADAYGHGAVAAAHALLAEGCGFFAVSCTYEAMQLRDAAVKDADILILGYSFPGDTRTLWENGIIQTVFSAEYAAELSREMQRLCGVGILPPDAALRVHIKLDTGMNRLGFDAEDAERAAEEIAAVCRLPHLSAEGLFTHFACADTEKAFTGMSRLQYMRFRECAAALSRRGCCPPFLHCCNSAGALGIPEAYEDGVRAGVILYGMTPDGSLLPEYRPVMTLKTRIAHVHTLHKGESVSYGAAFTAPQDMRIATLPIGYADGFVRRYAGASVRLPDGSDAPIVGRICMDQCMIAIGNADVHPGDAVTLFGGDDPSRIETLAQCAGTINYEITCLLAPRVPRIIRE